MANDKKLSKSAFGPLAFNPEGGPQVVVYIDSELVPL